MCSGPRNLRASSSGTWSSGNSFHFRGVSVQYFRAASFCSWMSRR